MPDVGADLEKRRHLADERQMVADHRPAPHILFRIMGDRALRLAQRGEVVKLHLRALHCQGLRFLQKSISSASDRKSGSAMSGECERSSSIPTSPVATASTRIPLALAASTSFG